MSMSRRQFILGTAAGLILPSYYDKALAYFENTGEALLDIPKSTEIELIAIDRGGDGYELNFGDPWAEPPEMTTKQFALRYFGSEENYLEARGYEDVDFDAQMNWWDVVDVWSRQDSPNALAYGLLAGLDLGPELTGKDAVGEIRFIDGPCPGNDYLGVEAPSQLDISLLPKRLNDLGAGIRISIV